MFVPCSGEQGFPNWAEFSLILPAVSIGNVGQLAIDLVVSALSSRYLIGYLHDASILPVAGNDAFAKPGHECGQLNTSAEVYKSDEQKLIIIQQRAPINKGYQALYCRKMIEWIKSCGFHRVILLSSISATERVDSQMQGSPLQYLVSKASEGLVKSFDNLSWTRLEKKPTYPDIDQGNKDEEYAYFIPGGGITKRMFDLCNNKDIPLTVLLTFCSEGDNISDAVRLFYYLNEWLTIIDKEKVESKLAGKPSDFIIPSSWSLMFGSPLAPVPLF
ncbi:proteasome assembly chaperone 2-like [Actinia tenebrosa]|uniref:Proteasome assembly chaperone 2 n=1 Tax=Actinia tenebrosa TaxID=6105 RepID=A0A6P8ILD4_ACTTE|nr:proteasome assembly chaperone 2-like [Actinia tenebrosa]